MQVRSARIVLGLVMGLAAAGSGRAQADGAGLDLERAVELALFHQPRVAADDDRAAAATDAERTRAAVFLPQIGLEASDLYTRSEDGKPIFVDNQGPREVAALLTGSQTVFDRAAAAAVAAARAESSFARYRSLRTRLEVAGAVTSTYFELDARRAAVGVWESAREQADAMDRATREGLEAGTRARLDLERAGMAVADARRGLEVARAQEQSSARLLGLMTGLEPLPALIPAPPIPAGLEVPSLDELETIALRQEPRLGMLSSLEERWRADLAHARGRRLPVIEARAAFGWDTLDLPWQVPAGWSAGLYLELPVFEGGALAAREAEARHELAAAAGDSAQGRLDLEQALARALGEASEALAAYRAAAPLVASSEEIVRITQEGYRAGRLSSLDLVVAQQDQTRSRLRRLADAARLRLALARLQLLTGRLPTEAGE